MEGHARISGHEVLRPSPRQIAVARAYVDGLERDRSRLHSIEEELGRATWEALQLVNLNRVLRQALGNLLHSGMGSASLVQDAEEILAASGEILDPLFACPCGHSKLDHDREGVCQFVHCRKVCSA